MQGVFSWVQTEQSRNEKAHQIKANDNGDTALVHWAFSGPASGLVEQVLNKLNPALVAQGTGLTFAAEASPTSFWLGLGAVLATITFQGDSSPEEEPNLNLRLPETMGDETVVSFTLEEYKKIRNLIQFAKDSQLNHLKTQCGDEVWQGELESGNLFSFENFVLLNNLDILICEKGKKLKKEFTPQECQRIKTFVDHLLSIQRIYTSRDTLEPALNAFKNVLLTYMRDNLCE